MISRLSHPGATLGTMADAENPEIHHPRFRYLTDGRLLTWSHRPVDDHTTHFRVTLDEWVGQHGISYAGGRQLLVDDHRQPNGLLLGPTVEPKVMKRYRPRRSRRW